MMMMDEDTLRESFKLPQAVIPFTLLAYTMSDDSHRLHVSIDLHCVPDLNAALNEALVASRFDAVLTPLVHPRLSRNLIAHADERDEPLTRSDLLLDSARWTTCVGGE